MELWQMLLIQVAVTAVVVFAVMSLFYLAVLKPFLNTKVQELIEAAENIEPKVSQGVKRGVGEAFKDIPEATVKESTRQFLRFGSDLFENGLSSFIGTAEDLARRSAVSGKKKSGGQD